MAWKYVVFFGISFPDVFQVPVAPVFTVDFLASFVAETPRAILTVTLERGRPPSVAVPLNVHVFFFLTYEARPPRRIGIGTNARASNVPAALGVPLPGVYGVKRVSHFSRPAPVGVVRILFTVNFASRSWAPLNARPGVPTGTSHGGRQILRLYAPRAVAAPAVGLT